MAGTALSSIPRAGSEARDDFRREKLIKKPFPWLEGGATDSIPSLSSINQVSQKSERRISW